MTEHQPVVAPPTVACVPRELMDRTQWVCWAFEWRADKAGRGKWTKVPYTPHTTKKARSNAASSWRSLSAALACYQERPDFFAGIGYMFSKDDPYVGGDIDHCIVDGVISPDALALLPDTYAEISPSGCGIKFIGRATGDYGRKTVRGELYSKARFFTITGNVLPGHETIAECQEAIDAFAAALGTVKTTTEGNAGSGSRAERAAIVPDEEWEAGRTLLRTSINRLVARLRASSISRKTGTDDTQLGMLLREDYAAFMERWPGAGIVRGDGSIDESQIRAVFANGIRIRGFVFSEYAAIMSHFFAEQALAKWGTKQAWREELASLWLRGRTPRADEAQPIVIAPTKRGRGSDHSALLDRAYATLETFKVGIDAILTIRDLAEAMYVSHRTAAALLAELTRLERITKRQNGQHGGVIISFSGMHNEKSGMHNKEKAIEALSHTNGSISHTSLPPMSASSGMHNEKSGMHNAKIIHEDIPLPDAVDGILDDAPMSAEQETAHPSSGMHNEPNDAPDFAAPDRSKRALCVPEDEREKEAPSIYIYNQYCVSPPELCIPQKRVSLADAVSEAFDELPRDHILPSGELKRWPVTAARVLAYVEERYAAQCWTAEAVRYWTQKVRKRRKAQTFDELRGMRREALEKKAASARKQIARAEEKAVTAEMPELRDWYAKRAGQLAGQQAIYAWELSQRDAKDAARIESEGYSLGEQAEMMRLVEREYTPAPRPAKAASVSPPTADIGGLIARLKARKAND